ncbi:MAG: HD domain-containing phosphohydrolase [Candidatus Latescibacterota bacterium]|nr:HD domain-containing phosphohydrolase [Candidatus Latescibacterota bacterium]
MASDELDQGLEDLLRRLNEIGAALSLERDLHALLDRILLEARRFTYADAGTLYLVQGESLIFEITQNDTELSDGDFDKAKMPPVPLNEDSASGYAAVTGDTLNIDDVYSGETQFEGPKQYDALTGYHTQSMMVVPMRDHEDQIIGVLQLLNSKNPETGKITAFNRKEEGLVKSLASQAAVSINNVRLIEDTERLFESFVQVMATAIDERSPYTGGHIRRVAEMTMAVAQAVNECEEGPLADVYFDEEEMAELRIAAWMHDIGKITTPEWVVDKPTKLTTIVDRMAAVRTRFQWMRSQVEVERLEKRLEGRAKGDESDFDRRQQEIDDDLAFLKRINLPGESMEEVDLKRLKEIASKRYLADVEPLTEDEVLNLSITRGTLTDAERQKINDHAEMSIRMLEQIPFTRKLSKVPAIAGAHHEWLNGKGYPRGLKGDEISLQARILALVDILESISADDRPYRAKPMTKEAILRILQKEVEVGHLDAEVHSLFLRCELFKLLEQIKQVAAS